MHPVPRTLLFSMFFMLFFFFNIEALSCAHQSNYILPLACPLHWLHPMQTTHTRGQPIGPFWPIKQRLCHPLSGQFDRIRPIVSHIPRQIIRTAQVARIPKTKYPTTNYRYEGVNLLHRTTNCMY